MTTKYQVEHPDSQDAYEKHFGEKYDTFIDPDTEPVNEKLDYRNLLNWHVNRILKAGTYSFVPNYRKSFIRAVNMFRIIASPIRDQKFKDNVNKLNTYIMEQVERVPYNERQKAREALEEVYAEMMFEYLFNLMRRKGMLPDSVLR